MFIMFSPLEQFEVFYKFSKIFQDKHDILPIFLNYFFNYFDFQNDYLARNMPLCASHEAVI